MTVRFEDGREERGDVLIGADGINSAVRQQIQGDSEPRYSGVAVCQAVCKTDEQLITPRIYGMQWGRGTRFGYYPILGGAFWYLLVAAPKDYFADPATRRQKCAEHLAGWAAPAEKLLAAVPDEGLIAGNISDREPVRKWGEGRVTLAGDAAHAMTPFLGQGGGQGIEDAAAVPASASAFGASRLFAPLRAQLRHTGSVPCRKSRAVRTSAHRRPGRGPYAPPPSCERRGWGLTDAWIWRAAWPSLSTS